MSDDFSTTRLYVGNLPTDSTDADDIEPELINLFMVFGEIHDYTKRSEHGFMFIEFMIPEQASAALQSMNKYYFKGRSIKVQFAKKREYEKKKDTTKKDLERYLQAGGMSSWVGGHQQVSSTGMPEKQNSTAAASSQGDGLYSGWTTGSGYGDASGYSAGGGYSASPPSYANPYGSGTGEGGGYDTSKQKPMNYGYSTGQPSQNSNNAPSGAQPPSYPPGAPQPPSYPPGAPQPPPYLPGAQQQPAYNMQYQKQLPEYTTDKWSLLDAAKWAKSVGSQQVRSGGDGGKGQDPNQRDRSLEKTMDRSTLRNRWDNDKGRGKDPFVKKPSNDVPMDPSPPAQANDVEIVCQSQEYTTYAEWIEERLGTRGLKVDILYPNPEITLVHLLSNIAARKGIFAIVVNADSRERRCFDMYVLQGELQEHKNIPESEALHYIVRNYSKLSSKLTGKLESAERPNFGITSEISRIFLDIRDDRDLDIAAYDKAIQYLVHNREGLLKDEYGSRVPTHLLVPPCTPAKESMLRGKQEEVQEYILEILNKNPDILTQTKEMPKIKLSEPTISSSINMSAKSVSNHQPVIGGNNMSNMSGMNMNDMGKLFGMMQNIMKSNPSMFNS